MMPQSGMSYRGCIKNILRISKIISFLICFALFIVLTVDILNKFFKGMTNIGIVSVGRNDDTKFLPCVTLCPWSAYREKTFCYTSSDYMKATFNMSEILMTTKTPMVDNLDDLDITELRSINLGRCYMICFKKAYPVTTTKYLWIKRASDVIVYITPKSSAMWIRMTTSAIKLTSFTLDLSNMPKLASVEISLMERRTKKLNKGQMECRDYAMVGDYEQCAREFISSQLTQQVNCSLPGIEDFTANLTECTDRDIAIRTFKAFIRHIYDLRQDWVNHCPVPCSQTSYIYTLKKMHSYSWLNADYNGLLNDSMALMLTYETFAVEDQSENYIYDAGSFLSSAGGNLGLLLGFSCFTVMLQFINLMKKCLFKRYNWASSSNI